MPRPCLYTLLSLIFYGISTHLAICPWFPTLISTLTEAPGSGPRRSLPLMAFRGKEEACAPALAALTDAYWTRT